MVRRQQRLKCNEMWRSGRWNDKKKLEWKEFFNQELNDSVLLLEVDLEAARLHSIDACNSMLSPVRLKSNNRSVNRSNPELIACWQSMDLIWPENTKNVCIKTRLELRFWLQFLESRIKFLFSLVWSTTTGIVLTTCHMHLGDIVISSTSFRLFLSKSRK